MTSSLQYSRVYAPILVAVSILIGLYVLRPSYMNYLSAETNVATAQRMQTTKQNVLNELETMKKTFSASGNSLLAQKIAKLNKKWDSGDIMSAIMLNNYTKGSPIATAPINIGSIVVDK